MSAALELKSLGLSVTVADDQPAPGGRIFAAIETRPVHGREDQTGADLVSRFRSLGGTYLPSTEAWQVETGPRVFLTHDGLARMLEPRFVVMATGAQERPMPFPGWQLPGVMTVGGAQILLKTARQIPDVPVWLAGTGPLLLLYAYQLISAGGTVSGIFDTNAKGRAAASAPLLPSAIPYGWREFLRGFYWMVQLRKIPVIRQVNMLEAIGTDRLSSVKYATRDGKQGEVSTELLLIHDGVVPSVHSTWAAGCDHRWHPVQKYFEPVLDEYGASSVPAIFVAGDGATIGGARAAMVSGRLAAVGVALAAGVITDKQASTMSSSLRRPFKRAAGFRRFIDSLYPPSMLPMPDTTIVCRCEEVTAGRIREALAERSQIGPDGVKIATRSGMGPCQGRQCGLNITRLVSEVHGTDPTDVGFLRIRPPLKPLTLRELAALDTTS